MDKLKTQRKTKQKSIFSTGDWIALAGVFGAMIFSLLGYLSVNTSLQQSQVSLEILANKEGVYLEPVIGIDALMYKNSQLGSPKIFIFNNGKVEAINVVVQIIRRQFDGQSFLWCGVG